MASQWFSSETVHYIIGGYRHHSQWFAKWLVEYKSSQVDTNVEDTDHNMQTQIEDCMFPDEDVMLDHHHMIVN